MNRPWHLRLALLWISAILLTPITANAQRTPDARPQIGLAENVPTQYALINARVIPQPGEVIESGTILIEHGIIQAIGADLTAPATARVIDYAGKTIYPGFIDAYGDRDIAVPTQGAPHWNNGVTPQRSVADEYQNDAASDRALRRQGFVARLVAPRGGQIKGTSIVASTNDAPTRELVLRENVALHVSLTTSRQASGYPRSPMGAVALVRQAFYDATWYRDSWRAHESDRRLPRPARNDALAALASISSESTPVIVDTASERDFFRADRLASEFNLPVIVRASGREYRRLDTIAAANRTLLLPINFPKAPYVGTPEAARDVTLERLLHWDMAPENPARLAAANVRFAITTDRLDDKSQFLPNLRAAIERGLPEDFALQAITTVPAEILGVENDLGSLAVGKRASWVVTDGSLANRECKVLETWVDGKRFEHTPLPDVDVRGRWMISATDTQRQQHQVELFLLGTPDKVTAKARATREPSQSEQPASVSAEYMKVDKLRLANSLLSLSLSGKVFDSPSIDAASVVRITLVLPDSRSLEQPLTGNVSWPDGLEAAATATRTSPWSADLEQTEEQTTKPENEANPEAKDVSEREASVETAAVDQAESPGPVTEEAPDDREQAA
ncbi:MAG: amidohydrolase family protein, partial [Planctomycetales bacterium]|nr:amidohydrolase family protein [Planctomycetales bacterium]